MQASRSQIIFTILAGVFLLGTVPDLWNLHAGAGCGGGLSPVHALLVCSDVFLFLWFAFAWLLRGPVGPYNQLVGEAKRAPVAHSSKTQNEAAFVLETFQTVIAHCRINKHKRRFVLCLA